MGYSGLQQRLLSVLMLGAILPAAANPQLRSSFPGRRVAGRIRGECTARMLVHLVPHNSVFAPDSDRLLGILQGPTQAPKPLLMDLGRLATAGTVSDAQNLVQRLRLDPLSVGVTLFHAPVGRWLRLGIQLLVHRTRVWRGCIELGRWFRRPTGHNLVAG